MTIRVRTPERWEVATGGADMSPERRARTKAGEVRVPQRIELLRATDEDGELLEVIGWRAEPRADEPDQWKSDHGVLTAFMRLAGDDVKAEAFLRFGQRFGPLVLCSEHGLPPGHPKLWPYQSEHCTVQQAEGGQLPEGDWLWFTPVEEWRALAKQVRAALTIAANLRDNPPRPGSSEDWEELAVVERRLSAGPPLPLGTPRDGWRHLDPGDIAEQRQSLWRLLDLWIEAAGLRPVISWTEDSPTFNLASDPYSAMTGVFPAVAKQLLFAVHRVKDLRLCAACGRPFFPYQRWKYCEPCAGPSGKKASDRLRKREERAADGA